MESGAGGEEAAYAAFLPLVEGAFRASLQGSAGYELELRVKSGDADTRAPSSWAPRSSTLRGLGRRRRRAKYALKTLCVRAETKLPGIIDYFGWCTWDAFYHSNRTSRRRA